MMKKRMFLLFCLSACFFLMGCQNQNTAEAIEPENTETATSAEDNVEVATSSTEKKDDCFLKEVNKPNIYLYPETEMPVSVTLDFDGELTCTYPQYQNGWNVTAKPDGTLSDGTMEYNYLFWEGKTNQPFLFDEGFCVKGEDTAEFLEEALAKLGLNRREANEFIVYWLPQMQNNAYNVISFQGENYRSLAKLTVSPQPQTEIRVFMSWYGSDTYQDIPSQTLTAPERNGFTVVEWGGGEVPQS